MEIYFLNNFVNTLICTEVAKHCIKNENSLIKKILDTIYTYMHLKNQYKI